MSLEAPPTPLATAFTINAQSTAQPTRDVQIAKIQQLCLFMRMALFTINLVVYLQLLPLLLHTTFNFCSQTVTIFPLFLTKISSNV